MERELYEGIKSRIKNYKFNSLIHTDYEEILDYEVILDTEKCVLLYGYNKEMKLYEFSFAADEPKVVLDEINRSNKAGLITFIPNEWVCKFKENGFDIFAIWNDYFNQDISKYIVDDKIEKLSIDECKQASDITLSCRGQSRGFAGQSEEWIYRWINGIEPTANMFNSRDSSILVHRENNTICGIVCIAIYGDNRQSGSTLWIREIAVSPEYQNRGIGKKLLNQALLYGVKNGAKKSYLMADECNNNAIHLYRKMGFYSDKIEHEITMIKDK
ncbi:GNAT family N-acetyltransferase [Romboutsia weinsteinii]|uniref:GNAT family N-acetyltransferase n=1 Tax=Romboutsia weinsteinii TaxID=2020949 RepID=A0A371J557_9FIRM|nr:GNAT family N-acetyltransferase [Romboutsia weinsteinii]RDY27824.1 GNAT family N-acetyltransferase [Romboutsia weinsteinii]